MISTRKAGHSEPNIPTTRNPSASSGLNEKFPHSGSSGKISTLIFIPAQQPSSSTPIARLYPLDPHTPWDYTRLAQCQGWVSHANTGSKLLSRLSALDVLTNAPARCLFMGRWDLNCPRRRWATAMPIIPRRAACVRTLEFRNIWNGLDIYRGALSAFELTRIDVGLMLIEFRRCEMSFYYEIESESRTRLVSFYIVEIGVQSGWVWWWGNSDRYMNQLVILLGKKLF